MSNNESDKVSRTDCSPWHDADTVRHYYIEKEYSLKEVGETLGCAECTVLQWCRRHGVETRDPQEARDTGTPEDFKDGERMRELYLTLELTCEEIAKEYDVTPLTVSRWLRRHGIPTRPAHGLGKETQVCQCENCGDMFDVIPSRADGAKYCSQECYHDAFDMPTGSDHWSWKDGEYNRYTGKEWTRLRERCLERDGYECVLCGCDNDEHSLHAHHLNPLRNYDDPQEANRMDNLVMLCPSCHRTVERMAPLLPPALE